MLKIERKYVDQVRQAAVPADLYDAVQKAIELEHSTIPTYLCAYFTLKTGTNQEVASIIRSVVMEEMLHMCIASNLMIAIGGHPVIDKPGFVPVYPGPLPMNIGDVVVPLQKCSLDLIQNVFMEIEKPEHPIEFPTLLKADGTAQYATIGEFYAAIDAKLRELGQSAFIGRFDEEFVDNSWFPPDQLFPISSPRSASDAIQVIVRQGEGTPTSPLDAQGEVAHYYRFEQIVKGRLLVQDRTEPTGFAFRGAVVALDDRAVWNMQPNPDPDRLPAGSRARHVSILFAYTYTQLLGALHDTFNGDPRAFDRVMGLMYDLRLQAQEVLSIPLPGDAALQTGLAFRYQPYAS